MKMKTIEKDQTQLLTRVIVNCWCSAYSSVSARVKSRCNSTVKYFEISN